MTTAFPFAPTPAPAPKPSPIDASGDNLIGIIGVASAGLGTLLSFSAITAAFGAPLVQAGFILGVVGLFPQGAKKLWPAVALVTAILGTALSVMLVQHQAASQFDSSTAEFTELERQLEQLDQRYSPYSDPLPGAGAANGWPAPNGYFNP